MLFIVQTEAAQYTIRVYWPESSKEYIASKYLWMTALQEETDLTLPRPIALQNGQIILEKDEKDFENDTFPQARYCVMREWVSGETFKNLDDSARTPELITRYGQTVARMILHGSQFNTPDWFDRPKFGRLNLEDYLSSKASANLPRQNEILKAGEELLCILDELGDGRDVFGLIHTELGSQNVLAKDGEIGIIDFNRCGWGYYFNSIQKAIDGALDKDDFSSFLAGYEMESSLPKNFDDAVEKVRHLRKLVGQWPG